MKKFLGAGARAIKAEKEQIRILKPSGSVVFTVPFHIGNNEDMIYARHLAHLPNVEIFELKNCDRPNAGAQLLETNAVTKAIWLTR